MSYTYLKDVGWAALVATGWVNSWRQHRRFYRWAMPLILGIYLAASLTVDHSQQAKDTRNQEQATELRQQIAGLRQQENDHAQDNAVRLGNQEKLSRLIINASPNPKTEKQAQEIHTELKRPPLEEHFTLTDGVSVSVNPGDWKRRTPHR